MPEEVLKENEEMQQDHTKDAGWVEKANRADNDYKQRMRLPQKYKIFEDFKNGNQWPAVQKGTEDLPRPVFNMVKFIEDHKVNAVKNSTVKIVYSNNEGDYVDEESGIEYSDGEKVNAMAEKFTNFVSSDWERLKMEQINDRVCHTSCNKGLGVVHFIYEPTVKGGRKLKWMGASRVETINPLNLIVANPQSLDIQPQDYVGIKGRETVKFIRKKAILAGATQEQLAKIKADKDTIDRTYDASQVEVDNGDGKANTITIYFKDTVQIKSMEQQMQYDEAGQPLLDEMGQPVMMDVEVVEEKELVFYQKYACGVIYEKAICLGLERYPIAIFPWDEVEDCIFAKAEPDGMINNQRIINLIIACMTKSVENSGFPKVKYRKGAINPAALNSAIGGFIEVNEKATYNMNDVDYMHPGQISSVAQPLVDIYMEYTKNLAGATETSTGTMSNSDLNATAINLLQKASQIPIDGIRNRYYQYIEDCALILADIYKNKYTTARLADYNDKFNEKQTMLFRGSDAEGIDFACKVDVGPASNYSEFQTITTLKEFVTAGYITFDQLLKYAPKNMIPFKEQLIKEREQMAMQQAQEEDAMMVEGMNDAEKQIFEAQDPQKQQATMQKLRLRKKMNMENMMMQQEQGGKPQRPSQPGGNIPPMAGKSMPG
jgi:hypothetical protein